MHHAAVRDLHVRMLRNGPDGERTIKHLISARRSRRFCCVRSVSPAVFGCFLMLWSCLLDSMRLIRWFIALCSFCKQPKANTALHGADGQYGCLRPPAYLLV